MSKSNQVLIITMVILFVGMFSYVLFSSFSQDPNPSSQIFNRNISTNNIPIVDSDLNTKCSSDAENYYNNIINIVTGNGYSSHYNKSLKECLISYSYTTTLKSNNITYDYFQVDDVKNAQLIGTYWYFLNYLGQPIIGFCTVGGQPCDSLDQYNIFINPYMKN